MRFHQIRRRPATTECHPFVVDVTVHPDTFSDFERLMEMRQDVRMLCRIDRPGSVLVHLGCSSEGVRRELQNTWGQPRVPS